MKDARWKPDFGPEKPHPTGGATAVGARMPLVCFNINLDTPNVEVARKISQRVRSINGGFYHVKTKGIFLDCVLFTSYAGGGGTCVGIGGGRLFLKKKKR